MKTSEKIRNVSIKAFGILTIVFIASFLSFLFSLEEERLSYYLFKVITYIWMGGLVWIVAVAIFFPSEKSSKDEKLEEEIAEAIDELDIKEKLSMEKMVLYGK